MQINAKDEKTFKAIKILRNNIKMSYGKDLPQEN